MSSKTVLLHNYFIATEMSVAMKNANIVNTIA